jgi:hypothetical protein
MTATRTRWEVLMPHPGSSVRPVAVSTRFADSHANAAPWKVHYVREPSHLQLFASGRRRVVLQPPF